jgi:RNA polymerase sigma-70 factor (ECF subfamily)
VTRPILRSSQHLSRLASSSNANSGLADVDERRLVCGLVSGDGDAWREFVNSFGRIIRSRVADIANSFGCAGDGAAIDDATAEVFAVLLSNDAAALRAFEGRSRLSTYLAVIATRIATRGFATKQFATSSRDSVDERTPDSSVKEPLGILIETEQREQVVSLLEQLPIKQREVVRLFHLQGQSYAQIGATLDMPIGSVGVTLRRGEAKLRTWLESSIE